jgi:hypothetical protein
MGEHEACNDSSVMSHRDVTLATSFGQTIRCQVSEMIDLNTETRTLKP